MYGDDGSLEILIAVLLAVCAETPRHNRVSENVCGRRIHSSASHSPQTIVFGGR